MTEFGFFRGWEQGYSVRAAGRWGGIFQENGRENIFRNLTLFAFSTFLINIIGHFYVTMDFLDTINLWFVVIMIDMCVGVEKSFLTSFLSFMSYFLM